MALLPNIGYDSLVPKALSLLGYNEKKRAILTDGILEAIRKVNESDVRIRRMEAALLTLADRIGAPRDDIARAMLAAEEQERAESAAELARLAALAEKGDA